MNNLISNALKATDEQGVIEIIVRDDRYISRKDSPVVSERFLKNNNGFISIIVKDNGKGIAGEEIPSVFNRFYQSKNSHTGTGVGLALTKSLVELHKGIITLNSVLGEGTTFEVLLPKGKDHFDPVHTKELSELDDTFIFEIDRSVYLEEGIIKNVMPDDEKCHNKPTLLIVEDNEEVREYLRVSFLYQYKVIEAKDGLEALNMAADINPDIVISDIMMPNMDGLELCKKLKTDMVTSHIPVILLTAKTAVENIIEGTKTGADLYISKPFQPEILKIQVDNLLANRNRVIQKFIHGEISHPGELSEHPLDIEFMNKVIKVINVNLGNDNFSVEELADYVCMSRSNLFRKLKSLTGQSPIEFIFSLRLRKSIELLTARKMNVAEIADEVGFKSSSAFSKAFKKQFGKSPSQFLKNLADKNSVKNTVFVTNQC